MINSMYRFTFASSKDWDPDGMESELRFSLSFVGSNAKDLGLLVSLAIRSGVYQIADRIEFSGSSAKQLITDRLETVFEITNGMYRGEEVRREKISERTPSGSVGDLVLDLASGSVWICANVGFVELPKYVSKEIRKVYRIAEILEAL